MDYSPIKKILQDLLDEKQKMKVQAESDRIKKNDEDRAAIISTIGKDLTDSLKPVLEELAKNSKISSKELRDAIESTLNINIPPIKVPEANVNVTIPPIKVPTPIVNFDASKIKMPKIEMPSEMDIKGWVRLQGVDLDHPLPVQLRDASGKPYNLLDGLTTMIAGSGGKADYLTIKGFGQSAFSVPVNSDGQVMVAGTFTASAPATTYVISGNSEGVVYNGDNPLPVIITSGAGGSTAAALIDSSGIQYSGSNPLPVVITSGASATSATNIVDSSGIAYSGSNPVPVTGSVAVSGLTGSIATANIDSSGIQYSGSNPFPFKLVTDATATLNVVNVDSAGNYRGTFPVSGSVAVSGVTGSIGATILDGDGIMKTTWVVSSVTASIGVTQLNGDGTYKDTQPISGTVTVGSITNTIAANIVDSTGVAYESTNPFPVAIVSGGTATSASNIVDSSGVAYTGSNPVPVAIVSGAGSTTAGTILNGDGTYRDTFPVSGSIAVSGVTGSISVTQLNGDGTYKDTQPVSGTVAVTNADLATIAGAVSATHMQADVLTLPAITGTVTVGSVTASIAAMNVDSSGIGYSGSNPLPITWVSGAGGGATTAAMTVDSTGVAYTGSNPMPVILVSNVASSTVVVGPTAEGGTDDGTNPLKMGGIARTTNPAAHSDGQTSSVSLDSLGRQINRPVQMRGLIATAYVALTTGTEATLLAATAGKYNDLIYVLASNNSTVAVGVDLRAVTAGNILLHLEIPPNSTTGLSIPVPMFGAFADASGNNWTADMADVTGTTVYVSALFSQEI